MARQASPRALLLRMYRIRGGAEDHPDAQPSSDEAKFSDPRRHPSLVSELPCQYGFGIRCQNHCLPEAISPDGGCDKAKSFYRRYEDAQRDTDAYAAEYNFPPRIADGADIAGHSCSTKCARRSGPSKESWLREFDTLRGVPGARPAQAHQSKRSTTMHALMRCHLGLSTGPCILGIFSGRQRAVYGVKRRRATHGPRTAPARYSTRLRRRRPLAAATRTRQFPAASPSTTRTSFTITPRPKAGRRACSTTMAQCRDLPIIAMPNTYGEITKAGTGHKAIVEPLFDIRTTTALDHKQTDAGR